MICFEPMGERNVELGVHACMRLNCWFERHAGRIVVVGIHAGRIVVVSVYAGTRRNEIKFCGEEPA